TSFLRVSFWHAACFVRTPMNLRLRLVGLISAFPLAACTASPGEPGEPSGPVERALRQAAAASGGPRDLPVAVAATEGGLKLPAYRAVNAEDHVLVAGMLELRHGQFNSLARAAQLSGLSEPALCADTDRATVVGALVLAELGAQTGARSTDLSSWR